MKALMKKANWMNNLKGAGNRIGNFMNKIPVIGHGMNAGRAAANAIKPPQPVQPPAPVRQ